jgi:hypothetical protein
MNAAGSNKLQGSLIFEQSALVEKRAAIMGITKPLVTMKLSNLKESSHGFSDLVI